MERPIFLPRCKQIRIKARRNRRDHIGTPVHRGHCNLRRAHGIGKLYQHARPEIIVERCLVDQVDQSNELYVSAHGTTLSARSAPQCSSSRIATHGGFLDF